MKIVINTCFGGYGLSQAALKRLVELGIPKKKYIKNVTKNVDGFILEGGFRPLDAQEGQKDALWNEDWIPRTHPLLIQTIEELGAKACSGSCADLKIVEIPDEIEYYIDDYDGYETIHEKHQSWG